MADRITEQSLTAVKNITAVIGARDHAIWAAEARTQAYQRKTKEWKDQIREIKKRTSELKEDNDVKKKHLEQVKLTNEVHRSLLLLLRNIASRLIEMKYVKEQRDSLLEEKYNSILEERQSKFGELRSELLASNERYQELRRLQIEKRKLSFALLDYRVRIENLGRQRRLKEEIEGKIFRVRIVRFAEAVVKRRVCELLHSELKKHELLEKDLVRELLDLQNQLNEKKKSSISTKKLSTQVPKINFEFPPPSSNKYDKKLSIKEKFMKIAELSKIDMFPSTSKPIHVAEKFQKLPTALTEKPIKQVESHPAIKTTKHEDAQQGNKIKIIDVSIVKPQQTSQESKPAKPVKRPVPERYLKAIQKASEKKSSSLRNPTMSSVMTEDPNVSQCSQISSSGRLPTSRENIRKFISDIKSKKSGGKPQEKKQGDEKKPFKSCLKLSQEKNETDVAVAPQNKNETVQNKNVPAPAPAPASPNGPGPADIKISERKEETGKSKIEEAKIKSDAINDKLKSLFAARKRSAEAEICLSLKTPGAATQSEEKNMPPPPKSVRFAESNESTYTKSTDQMSTFQSKTSEFTFAGTETDTSTYSPHFDHAGFSPERPFLTSPPANFMFEADSEAENEEAGGKFLFGGSAARTGFSLFPNP